MTEHEWLDCTDPQKMLEFIRGKASERKLRLFKATCCRRIWHLLTEDQSRKAIEALEAFADGDLSAVSFEVVSLDCRTAYYHLQGILRETGSSPMLQARLFAANAACCATCESYPRYNLDAYDYAAFTSQSAGDAVGHSADAISKYAVKRANELRSHAASLREIMGNPFRPTAIDPSWLRWNGGTALQLAQGIYDDRAFDRLPLLADALTNAGCDNAEILHHCRIKGPHVRGCWVVDLILWKF